jgi:hypothetical protein
MYFSYGSLKLASWAQISQRDHFFRWLWENMSRVGQNRIYTPYIWSFPSQNTVCTPYIFMVLANPKYETHPKETEKMLPFAL